MLTLNRELTEVYHPLVKSFCLQLDFGAHEGTQKRLVIEAGFPFDHAGKKSEGQLMDLLVDLQGLLDTVEQKTGKLDCIDICPLKPRNRHSYESRFAA